MVRQHQLLHVLFGAIGLLKPLQIIDIWFVLGQMLKASELIFQIVGSLQRQSRVPLGYAPVEYERPVVTIHNPNFMASVFQLDIDEIGPMELSSIAFNDALVKAVESNKPMLGTIHYGLSNSLVNSIKIRDETEILKVTYENREDLHIMIANRITEHLTGSE